MNKLPDWLEIKFNEWEKTEGSGQTYYTFARYLDVGHSLLALWMTGAAIPQGEDIAKLAGKLGPEIYDILEAAPPTSPQAAIAANFETLPSAFQSRLASAITEAAQAIIQNKLNHESTDAKRLAAKVFEKWGFKVTG